MSIHKFKRTVEQDWIHLLKFADTTKSFKSGEITEVERNFGHA